MAVWCIHVMNPLFTPVEVILYAVSTFRHTSFMTQYYYLYEIDRAAAVYFGCSISLIVF